MKLTDPGFIEAAHELAAQYFYRTFPDSFSVYSITKRSRVKLGKIQDEEKTIWWDFHRKNGSVISIPLTFDEIEEAIKYGRV